MKDESKLYIETGTETSHVEIIGTRQDILFNWTALTHQICRKLGYSPLQLSLMLPGLIDGYQRNALKAYSEVDLSTMRKGGMEGQP